MPHLCCPSANIESQLLLFCNAVTLGESVIKSGWFQRNVELTTKNVQASFETVPSHANKAHNARSIPMRFSIDALGSGTDAPLLKVQNTNRATLVI